MAFIEILTGNGLTVESWESSIFETYIGKLMWKPFMGSGSNAIVQVKQDLSKKKGDAITIGIRGRVVGGKVSGNSKAIGNEGTITFYNQRLVVDNVRRAVKMEDIPMSEQRTAFGLLKEARAALEDEFAKDTDVAITQALTGDLTLGRVQGRYLYGAAESNYDATHATATATVDNTTDQLIGPTISIAKRKCVLPINAVNKIRPFKVTTGKNMEEWFVLVAHDYCTRDLVEATTAGGFRESLLNLTPRMATQASSSVIYNGSHFIGAYDGVLIYKHDELDLSSDGAASIQIAHNLMLGAQAGAVTWAQRAKFKEEPSDFGHDVSYELHEIRSIDSLVFSSTDGGTQEDNGIIHMFNAAVAD